VPDVAALVAGDGGITHETDGASRWDLSRTRGGTESGHCTSPSADRDTHWEAEASLHQPRRTPSCSPRHLRFKEIDPLLALLFVGGGITNAVVTTELRCKDLGAGGGSVTD
jgi:hypothetical protein